MDFEEIEKYATLSNYCTPFEVNIGETVYIGTSATYVGYNPTLKHHIIQSCKQLRRHNPSEIVWVPITRTYDNFAIDITSLRKDADYWYFKEDFVNLVNDVDNHTAETDARLKIDFIDE